MPAGGRARPFRATMTLLVGGSLLAVALAGCGSGGGSGTGAGASASDLAKALDTPTTLTFWTWAPNIGKTVALFEKKYPKIKVDVVNAGQSADEYTKLQTAVKAGSGGPDVAQVEYFALPQFALSHQVTDLSGFGADALKSKFTASAWAQVDVDGGVYGIPQDTGPEAMFYREDVLKKYGIAPPATWQQFEAAAEKIHAADPKAYITSIDPGDAGGVDSLLWQAGSRPFTTTKSTHLSVKLTDPGAAKWAALWSDLLSKKLVDPSPGWTNEWWQGMAGGKYALWITGAWAPGNIASTIPQTAGKWRVAPMPQWAADGKTTAENGGSANVVPSTSQHKAAAAAFAEWLNSDPGAAESLSADGLFPATTALLDDQSWLDKPIPVFGGQQANRILAQSSAQVGAGWQYLPFQVYANSVFKDTAGAAITSGADLSTGLRAWQKRITDYGGQQGFAVTSGS